MFKCTTDGTTRDLDIENVKSHVHIHKNMCTYCYEQCICICCVRMNFKEHSATTILLAVLQRGHRLENSEFQSGRGQRDFSSPKSPDRLSHWEEQLYIHLKS